MPWSRPVRAATGWVPGVQLSSPVRLTVYPVAGFELVSGIIDLRRGVCRNRGTQGENIALPGPDVELDVSVTMRVLRPYPHSRVILVAQDPNGALLKVSEVDNRMSPSDAPFEMGFSTVTPFFDTTGNYTFYLMAETPVDTATLGGAGLPGYSEPTTPGYGWVKIGTVTFLFRGQGSGGDQRAASERAARPRPSALKGIGRAFGPDRSALESSRHGMNKPAIQNAPRCTA